MSSWAALTERAKFVAGESVLINGATGAAGRLAIQICKYLGARRVIVTGRKQDNVNELSAFGADVIIPLDQSQEELTDAFKSVIEQTPVNVILDYLWGHSAESLFQALSGPGRKTGSPRIRYVNIGSVAGNTISFPAAVLRSSGLELLGTGLGSVSNDGLLKSISGVMQAIVPGKFQIEAEPVPLSELTGVWDREQPSKRIVFTL
jgi:NADPH:quinone reductase-like Zn-dependent oxidoreductase